MVGLQSEPWLELVKSVKQPVLFLNAVGAWSAGWRSSNLNTREPPLTRSPTFATSSSRNHMTMVFDPGRLR
jgi:hypothetical protein